jgi:hypothetical protein
MGSAVRQNTLRKNKMPRKPTLFSRVSVGWSDSAQSLVDVDAGDTGAVFEVTGAGIVDAFTIGGALTQTGAATLSSTLSVGGAVTHTGALTQIGAQTNSSTLSVGGALTQTGAATLVSTLSVGGATTLTGTTNAIGALSLNGTALAATADEINRAADVSTRLVKLSATTTLTVASSDGKRLLLDDDGGDTLVTVTLPAATGTGAIMDFTVGVVNTSNYVIKVADASDTIDGVILSHSSALAPIGYETAADSDTITLNGTTTGGAAIGDWIELSDISLNQWAVRGLTTANGTEATPFSATVS